MTQTTLKEIVYENCAEFEVLNMFPELKEVKKIKKLEKKEARSGRLNGIKSRFRRPGKERIINIEKVKTVMYERNFGIF